MSDVSALAGLPDFGAPLSATGGASASAFAPFGAGSFHVLPQALAIGKNPDGSPRLSLLLVKTADNISATGHYATLDLTVAGDLPLEACLAAARALDPAATVAPMELDGGFARLFPTNALIAPTPDLLTPVELGWAQSGYARWTTRLSVTAGAMVQQAIASTTSLIGARVEFAAAGVTPRVATTVSFIPSTLVAALIATLPSGSPARTIAESDLRAALKLAAVRATITAETAQADITETLADRIATAFCTFVSSPSPSDPITLVLADPATLSSELTHWDLSIPTRVVRHWVLLLNGIGGFDPATAASVVRYLTVPALQLGQWNIDLTSNLPPHRTGVAELGVTLDLPANPPFRPSSISHRLPLLEPDDRTTCALKLSPREPLAFNITPYAVLASAAGGVHTYTGPATPQTDTWIALQMPAFPVVFAHVSAAPRLLALCTLTVSVVYKLTAGPIAQQFILDANAPDISVALPTQATFSSVSITAQPTAAPGTTRATLKLGPVPAGRLALDLSSFAEYGPHRIDVTITAAPTQPLAIDFIAEADLTNPPARPAALFFYDGHLTGTWGYFATSPFQGGYCYRVANTTPPTTPSTGAANQASPQPWSAVQSPFAPLTLNPDGTLAANVPPQTTPEPQPALAVR